MSVPVVAFFNNKGGVGKTSLVYHLAHMFADLGVRVLAADVDPQADLSAAFLDDDDLENLWLLDLGLTIYRCVEPLVRGTGDIANAPPAKINDYIAIVIGDLMLSGFEDELCSQWSAALDGRERAFRVLSAFWRVLQEAAARSNKELILLDLGPDLGSINRAALIAADYVVVPLGPDLFSLQGIRNLGQAFSKWRREWQERLAHKPSMDIDLPRGRIEPIGYVVQQHSVRLDRPVEAHANWIGRIPNDYRKYVLCETTPAQVSLQADSNNLALLKHYPSLMSMAQEARKPMFALKPADGAIGSHLQAVHDVYREFKALALNIASRINLPVPSLS